MVNLVAAEGNPAAVMDLSFAVQALALAWLGNREGRGTLDPSPAARPMAKRDPCPPGCTTYPRKSMPRSPRWRWRRWAPQIDALTPDQQEYLDSWRLGS